MVYGLYIASVLGAIALVLMMPRKGYNPRMFGGLLGAATLGGLWILLHQALPDTLLGGVGQFAWHYVFSAIAIASAARVITHPRPVFAALWFIMLVVASSGLLLTLEAEFMAFAMVIIYGGAILVTYMFVIMLASSAGGNGIEEEADYDRVAREPVAASAAGFLLLAVLLTVLFKPVTPNPAMASPSDAELIATQLPRRADTVLTQNGEALPAEITGAGQLDSAERVGLDLFSSHPLGLELAGVILLVSLIGAVVIARQRVESETEPDAAA